MEFLCLSGSFTVILIKIIFRFIPRRAGLGLLITFEGIEGCGKSTQLELLKDHLKNKGKDILTVREPGGTPLGEKVRSILLDSRSTGMDPWAELFLYEACRAELVAKVIKPALNESKTVICDRFIDSTVAYQGYGRGLDISSITEANRLATGGLKPDITILIDCDTEAGLKRAWSRINAKEGHKEDRFEKEGLAFHKKVREGYLKLAKIEPRIKVVDGGGEIPSIHKEICDIIDKAL